MQAKYDPQEDRMWLTLHPEEGKQYDFWVTRRQWLGLFQAVASLPAAAPAAHTMSALRPRRLPVKGTERPTPVPLQGIRLRRLAAGVRVIFITEDASVGVGFPAAGVAQLLALLQQQADRAGWDAAAALARLGAAAMTHTATKKAHQLH